jgi:aerobic carbon-monoxide dehydrogenase large subunit
VVSPTADSELGAKGAGEAGTAGATGAVANAVNDALRVLGAREITEVPITPEGVLRAVGRGIKKTFVQGSAALIVPSAR